MLRILRTSLRVFRFPVMNCFPLRSFANDQIIDEENLMKSYFELRKSLIKIPLPNTQSTFQSDDEGDSNIYEEGKESPEKALTVIKKCTGCGAKLQTIDKNAIGFIFQNKLIEKTNNESKQILCNRCKALKYQNRVDNECQANVEILQKINIKKLLDKIFLQIPKKSVIINVIVFSRIMNRI